MIYISGKLQKEDEYEVAKLRRFIYNHIFKHAKVVKGEGVQPKLINNHSGKRTKVMIYGESHERPDLTKRTVYEYLTIKLVRIDDENSSLVKRALCWKTYHIYVHQEIRQLRGRVNSGMKTCVTEAVSEYCLW